MAAANPPSHPVQTLRTLSRALESSMRSCMAGPRAKAVHRLRTATRRVEAQITLLSLLAGLPPHRERSRKLLRLLKRIRQAAGQLRDIDVQRELIRTQSATGNGVLQPGRAMRSEARSLRRTLKHHRTKAADRLRQLLRRHSRRLTLILTGLLQALSPARSFALTDEDLIALVGKWYGDTPTPAAPRAAELHAIRKRAKLARYMVESASQSRGQPPARLRSVAARFDAIQQAGGNWHDRFGVAEMATAELGRTAKLSQLFSALADQALHTFRRRLRYKM